jgi:hypothetical protein
MNSCTSTLYDNTLHKMTHISCKLIPVALLTYSTVCVSSCKQLLYTRDHNIHHLQSFIHITHPLSITITPITKIHKEISFHSCIPMKCIHDFTFFLKNFCCNYHQQNGNSLPVSNLDSNLQNNKCI